MTKREKVSAYQRRKQAKMWAVPETKSAMAAKAAKKAGFKTVSLKVRKPKPGDASGMPAPPVNEGATARSDVWTKLLADFVEIERSMPALQGRNLTDDEKMFVVGHEASHRAMRKAVEATIPSRDDTIEQLAEKLYTSWLDQEGGRYDLPWDEAMPFCKGLWRDRARVAYDFLSSDPEPVTFVADTSESISDADMTKFMNEFGAAGLKVGDQIRDRALHGWPVGEVRGFKKNGDVIYEDQETGCIKVAPVEHVVLAPVTAEMWMNIYADWDGSPVSGVFRRSVALADERIWSSPLLGRIKVTFRDGKPTAAEVVDVDGL